MASVALGQVQEGLPQAGQAFPPGQRSGGDAFGSQETTGVGAGGAGGPGAGGGAGSRLATRNHSMPDDQTSLSYVPFHPACVVFTTSLPVSLPYPKQVLFTVSV